MIRSHMKSGLTLIFTVILLWFLSGSAYAAELIKMRTGEHSRFTRVVFEFRDAVRYKEPIIIGKGKFYVVFLYSAPASPRRLSYRTTKGVRSIKLIQKKSHLRADVLLSFPYFRLKTFYLSKPDRVVLDAYPMSAPPEEQDPKGLPHAEPVKSALAKPVQKKQVASAKKPSSTPFLDKNHDVKKQATGQEEIQFPDDSDTKKDLIDKVEESSAEKSNLDFRGFVTVRGGMDINEDLPNEQNNTFRNIVRLEGKWYLQEKRFFVLTSLESDYLWFGPDNDWEEYDLDLFEGYLFWSQDKYDITLGKQIVRWGKTDEISPIDNLNAQDFREFIVEDYSDRKIPNWMMKLRLFYDSLNLEGVYIPFFDPARIDYFGTDWAIFQQIKADVRNSDLPSSLKTYIDGLSVNEEPPSDTFENGEWGIRVSKTISDWDIGISYLYAWEDLPFFESFPIKNIVVDGSTSAEAMLDALKDAIFTGENTEVRYKRFSATGLEFETTMNVFGLRGEFAFFDKQSFLTNRLISIRKPVYHYVLGVDYVGERDWYINLQFSHLAIQDYDSDILYFDRNNTSINGEIEKDFWEGYFTAELRYSFSLNQESYYLSPALVFKYVPGLDISLGSNFFGGKADTLMGRYDANDEVFLRLKYFF